MKHSKMLEMFTLSWSPRFSFILELNIFIDYVLEVNSSTELLKKDFLQNLKPEQFLLK